MRRMNNVLILSAGRRVELAQAFKAELGSSKLGAKVFATDSNPSLAAACHVVDESFRTPRVTEPDYIDHLLHLCVTQGVGLVVPTIDTELLLLSRHRAAFESEGVHLIISDEPLVAACRDKRRTADLFRDLGIDTPKIFPRTEIKYPCFAKPYDGSRSIGAQALMDAASLTEDLLVDEKMMFMELIDSSHAEFTVDAYYDRRGSLKCLVPRERLEVRSGEVSKGITRRHHVYDYLLPKLQKIQGARGCLTLQLFANPSTRRYAALEINPRFGGGYPLSYGAGANYPGWLIREYLVGEDVPFFEGWEANLLMLRYDAKVLVHGG